MQSTIENTATAPAADGITTVARIMVNGRLDWWRVSTYTSRDGLTYARRIRPDGTLNKRAFSLHDGILVAQLPGKRSHKAARAAADLLHHII